MKAREIYPFWSDIHDDLIDQLELIEGFEWDRMFGQNASLSIRRIVVALIESERFWISSIAQGIAFQTESALVRLNALELTGEIKTRRSATLQYLSLLSADSFKAVRTVPGDAERNEIERNVTIEWIFWHLVENEITALGQIKLLMEF